MTLATGSVLSPIDARALEQLEARASASAAPAEVLIEALATKSWPLRRAIIAELSQLGASAAEALCHSFTTDRSDESRLAGVVDALVGSVDDVGETVRSRLSAADPAVVCDAIQILGRRHYRAALSELIALTDHSDDNVAVASIEALGRLGGAETVACLVAVLKSKNFFRVFATVDVLGRLGDARAVAPLVAMLDDPLVGAEAARALGRLGDETAIEPLVALLATGTDAAFRVAALALGDIQERAFQRYGTRDPLDRVLLGHARSNVVRSRLVRALASADANEKVAISRLLGSFPPIESVHSLLSLLGESGDIARAAASALGRLACAGSAEVLEATRTGSSAQRELLVPELAGCTPAVAVLVECLADEEPRVRIMACDALAKTGSPEAVPALFALLGDADVGVSQAAAAALQSLGSAETERLALAAATSEHRVMRRAALRLLAYFGFASALPILREAARDPDERIRETALSGLGIFDDEETRSLLLEMSEHPSARTRAAAVRALGQPMAAPQVIDRLKEASADPDPWVRYYACQGLGHTGSSEALTVLIERVEDPAGQVRVAAVDALSRLPGPTAITMLLRAAQHEDLDLRRAALVGIGVALHESLLPVLVESVSSEDAATRLVAISSLARYGSDEAIRAIAARAKDDSDATVRNAAIALLSENVSSGATEALVELLAIEPQRTLAFEALAKHARERLPALTAAFDQAESEVSDALAGIIARLPSDIGELPLLQLLSSPNAVTRRAAARALSAVFDSDRVRAELSRAGSRDPDPEVRRICAARLT